MTKTMSAAALFACCVMGAGCEQPGGPLTFAEQEQYCAASTACNVGDGGYGFYPGCVTGAPSQYWPSLRCAVRAGADCTAFRSCFGFTAQREGAGCGVYTSQCQGDAVVACSPETTTSVSYLSSRECGAIPGPRRTCVVGSDGNAGCGTGVCTTSGSRCATSTSVEECYSGIRSEYLCTDGRVCRERDGFASCVSSGELCTRSTCRGTQLIPCDYVDSSSYRFGNPVDCAAAGAHCELTSSGALCAPDGIECEPGSFTIACSGSSIRYCGTDGRIHQYDCAGHGFAGCREIDNGFSTGVVCVASDGDFRR